MGMLGLVEESNGLELNKLDVNENKSTARACLPIEGFLNVDAVRRFTESD